MLEFFFSLPKRLKEVKIVDTCEYELPEGSVLIGEATDTLKQILSLHTSLSQRITFLSESLETSCMDSERSSINTNLEKAKSQYVVVDGLLDLELIETFPDAYEDGKHTVFIGPNWSVFKILTQSLNADTSEETAPKKPGIAAIAVH